MAGLMTQQGNKSAPRNETATVPSGGVTDRKRADEDSTNVSPEEQAQYDEFVANGMSIIFGDQSMPGILKAIEGDGNPVEGIANALVTIVTRLVDSAEQAGMQLTGDVVFHGAAELLEHLVDLAEQANIATLSEEDVESALYLATDMYRAARQEQGKLPTEALAQDFNALQQAEQQGNIDDVLPGLSDFAKQGQKNVVKPQDQQRQGLLV